MDSSGEPGEKPEAYLPVASDLQFLREGKRAKRIVGCDVVTDGPKFGFGSEKDLTDHPVLATARYFAASRSKTSLFATRSVSVDIDQGDD